MSKLKRMEYFINLVMVKPIPTKILNYFDTDKHPEFQDWIADNMKPEIGFATGYAIINAAEDLAESSPEKDWSEPKLWKKSKKKINE